MTAESDPRSCLRASRGGGGTTRRTKRLQAAAERVRRIKSGTKAGLWGYVNQGRRASPGGELDVFKEL